MAYDSDITSKARDLVVLDRARAKIARGWCQGDYRDTKGGVCLLTAIGDSLNDIEGCLKGRDCNRWCDILGADADWNDAPGRTQAEVLARFDAAISKLGEA